MKLRPPALLRSVAALLAIAGAFYEASALTLVEDGASRATIVLPDQPSAAARAAANMLRAHLQEISGAEIGVVTEGKLDAAAKAKPMILVGEGALAKSLGMTAGGLPAGGFHAEAKGNVLALLGTDAGTPSDSFGSMYATVWLLENRLGVRYLWPGELGKVVPKQRTITIADFQHRSAPALAQRNIRSMGYHDRLQIGLNNPGFTDAMLGELDKLTAQAEHEAAGDADALKRVQFVRVGLRWTGIEVKAHRFLADPASADKKAAKQVLDERFALMREIFQKHPLAVNVGYVSWGEDGGWGQLGCRSPKP